MRSKDGNYAEERGVEKGRMALEMKPVIETGKPADLPAMAGLFNGG